MTGSRKRTLRRMMLVMFVTSSSFPTLYSYGKTKTKNPYDERRLLEQNKQIQRENNAPDDFPSFIREGFEVKVVASDNYIKRDSGLMYQDFEVGKGDCPKDGQQIIFQYIGHNESGAVLIAHTCRVLLPKLGWALRHWCQDSRKVYVT